MTPRPSVQADAFDEIIDVRGRIIHRPLRGHAGRITTGQAVRGVVELRRQAGGPSRQNPPLPRSAAGRHAPKVSVDMSVRRMHFNSGRAALDTPGALPGGKSLLSAASVSRRAAGESTGAHSPARFVALQAGRKIGQEMFGDRI